MNNPSSNTKPLSRSDFRRSIQKLLVSQIVLTLVFFCGLSFNLIPASHLVDCLIGYAIFVSLVTGLIFRSTKIQGRVKDAYPNYELHSLNLLLLAATPILAMILIAHLYSKKKETSGHVPIILKKYYLGTLSVTFLAFQFLTPTFSWWLSAPISYELYKSTMAFDEIHNLTKSKSPEDPLAQSYLKSGTQRLTMIEFTLLSIFTADEMSKGNKRSLATIDTTEAQIQQEMKFINKMTTLVQMSEAPVEFSDYGPIQWISPNGIGQIALWHAADMYFKREMSEKIVKKLTNSLMTLEKKIDQSSLTVQNIYKDELQKTRENLTLLKTYQYLYPDA